MLHSTAGCRVMCISVCTPVIFLNRSLSLSLSLSLYVCLCHSWPSLLYFNFIILNINPINYVLLLTEVIHDDDHIIVYMLFY